MSSSSETTTTNPTRELAAIMFSDIAGYTLIMGRDEQKGVLALAAHRELLRSLLPKFNGRMLGEIGDGTLSAFHSAVDAVNCAREVQATIIDDPELRLRIGIHVGDVLFSNNTIVGDGVNIASRIHALAPAGGICVSERVYDEIRNKPDMPVKDLGRQRLKNVTRPIRVYALAVPGGRLPYSVLLVSRATSRMRGARRLVLAAGVGALLLAAVVYGVVNLRLFVPGAMQVRTAQSKIFHSIAVLPLENLSGDPGQEYFADGMTEELITDLAKISALRVISRTSVMQFKGEHRKRLQEIAKVLDVDAVVEGSVLRVGDRVRITAQVIDAATDKLMWGDSYARDSHDVFALQDELASAIAREINVELTPQEKTEFTSARPVNPQAHEAYLKGRYYLNKWTQRGREQAKEHFELAIKIDPNFALGYAGLADYYWQAADWDLPDLVAMPRARELATRALQLDDSLAEAHTSVGAVNQYFDFNPAASERQLQRAIAFNPGYAEAHHVYGLLLTAQARFNEAETQMKEARQLNPLSPQFTADLALPLGWGGQPEKALGSCRKALQLDPGFFYAHFCLAINYGLMGNRGQALAEAESGVALEPTPLMMGALGYEFALSGNRQQAQKLIDQLRQLAQKSYVSEYYPATIYVGLGDRQKALDLLEQAYQGHSGALVFIGVDPRFDSLRSDPRFKDLLKKVGTRT